MKAPRPNQFGGNDHQGRGGLWRATGSASPEPWEWIGPAWGRKDPVITKSGAEGASLIKSGVHCNS